MLRKVPSLSAPHAQTSGSEAFALAVSHKGRLFMPPTCRVH